MPESTATRYAALDRAVEGLLSALACTKQAHREIDPRFPDERDDEARELTELRDRALIVAVLASEMEGDPSDPSSCMLARTAVATRAAEIAADSMPIPLDRTLARVSVARDLLQAAMESW